VTKVESERSSARPLGRSVYVASQGDKSNRQGIVSAYHIGPDGAPTPLVGSPFLAGRFSISIAVDLLGRFGYVTDQNRNNLSAYRIGPNGALTPLAPSSTIGNATFGVHLQVISISNGLAAGPPPGTVISASVLSLGGPHKGGSPSLSITPQKASSETVKKPDI
jgi:hypothetical protein